MLYQNVNTDWLIITQFQQTITKWVEHKPSERLQFLQSLVSEIDVWQVPAEKLLSFVNSEILLRRLRDSVQIRFFLNYCY